MCVCVCVCVSAAIDDKQSRKSTSMSVSEIEKSMRFHACKLSSNHFANFGKIHPKTCTCVCDYGLCYHSKIKMMLKM